MKTKLQEQCLLERVGSLKEIVYEEAFLHERPRPFSKNGYIFQKESSF